VQRQTDLQASQQKLLDSYEAQARQFQEYLATEAKQIRELDEVEAGLLRARLAQERLNGLPGGSTLPVAQQPQGGATGHR
jgi:hypothetical protein